eukprot:4383770-Amphidinium_carterae.1
MKLSKLTVEDTYHSGKVEPKDIPLLPKHNSSERMSRAHGICQLHQFVERLLELHLIEQTLNVIVVPAGECRASRMYVHGAPHAAPPVQEFLLGHQFIFRLLLLLVFGLSLCCIVQHSNDFGFVADKLQQI